MTTQMAVEQQQDLGSLIDLYLLRCQVEGKSPNTITAYRETLTKFQGIAREEDFPEDVRAIAPPHIYAYLGRIDSLMFLGDDYRGWLARPRPLPISSGLRVALVSKLFNNLSRFSVCHFRTDVLSSPVVGSMFLQERECLPTYCLAPDGPGPEALMVSNSRVALPEGRTFAQTSLCQFYRALQLASKANDGKRVPEDGLCLPLRTLDPECLVGAGGASVLARLLEYCDYLIVEDADLRPTDLVEHLQTFSLHTLTARDVTRALGLAGNYAYVLCPRNTGVSVPGERLW
jgi:hypothetical protein